MAVAVAVVESVSGVGIEEDGVEEVVVEYEEAVVEVDGTLVRS